MAKAATKRKGIEQERKFLVPKLPGQLSRYPHATIEQGYLAVTNSDRNATEVRLLGMKNHFVLTFKKGLGQRRFEEEIPIAVAQARSLWPLTRGRRIKKVRYKIPYRGLTVELDVYADKARGLAVAEVEFDSSEESRRFHPPPWFGKEVTGKKAFRNAELAAHGWRHSRSKGK
jgi:adenylate cyclase